MIGRLFVGVSLKIPFPPFKRSAAYDFPELLPEIGFVVEADSKADVAGRCFRMT